jgi:hypothetical protein
MSSFYSVVNPPTFQIVVPRQATAPQSKIIHVPAAQLVTAATVLTAAQLSVGIITVLQVSGATINIDLPSIANILAFFKYSNLLVGDSLILTVRNMSAGLNTATIRSADAASSQLVAIDSTATIVIQLTGVAGAAPTGYTVY